MTRNIVMELTKKKASYAEARRRVKEDADRRIREYDREIDKINQAISTINDAVKDYLCPVCGGSGMGRRSDAAGQMEDVPCTACGGTGVRI